MGSESMANELSMHAKVYTPKVKVFTTDTAPDLSRSKSKSLVGRRHPHLMILLAPNHQHTDPL